MKKTTTVAALLAAMLGAASTSAPEVINNTPGISQQQGQWTAPNQNRNAPEQRVVVRQQQAVQNGLPFVPGFLAHESGLPPKYYGIHLQQTDGEWDRHWDFTKEGIVTPQLIKEATAEAGLDDIYQYLEVVTIYEDDDDAVYDRMKRTMEYLHKNLD